MSSSSTASSLLVVESWGHVNTTSGYEEVAGELLFRNIFQIAPEAQHMFGFGKEFPIGCEEVYKTEQFRKHTIQVISTIDKAINMLQNSTNNLNDLLITLKKLGIKHAEYEAKEQHYVVVGQALIMMLEKVLGDQNLFSSEIKVAWIDIYQLIQDTMLQGAKEYFGDDDADKENENEKMEKDNYDTTTTATTTSSSAVEIVQKSWDGIKSNVIDYERVIGGLLFRKLFAKIPNVQTKFGFGKELPIGSEELYKLERFERHSTLVIKALDKTIKLLRPTQHNNNTCLVYAKPYLFELGQIHAEHEITSEQYDLFATCLLEVLSSQDLLSKHQVAVGVHGSSEAAAAAASLSSFTSAESKKAWSEILEMIKVAMLDGAKSF